MLRDHIPERTADWILAAFTVGCCVVASLAAAYVIRLPEEGDFNVPKWELQHLANKSLYLTGRLIDGKLTAEAEDARLARYLALTAEIDDAASAAAGGDETARARLPGLQAERSKIENDVEAIIEGRITDVLEDEGLTSSIPLFPDAQWVFPPVDTELAATPRELAISRRDRIDLIEQRALEPGLSREETERREAQEEQQRDVSALVVPLSGVATYPSAVAPDSDYHNLVSTIAHEWVHQYLYFKPLGRRILDSTELRSLNETVADIAGNGIADLVVARDPLPAATSTPQPSATRTTNVGAVLRQLRVEIEALLAQGKVGQAEALMEQRRAELARDGVRFRKINQAFFAFYGLYGDNPAAGSDPLAANVRALRDREGSVGAFLRAAARITDARDLQNGAADAPQD